MLALVMLTAIVGQVWSQDTAFLPANVLMLDDKFTHHVILVEKATHKLYLYENNGSMPKLVKTFSTATGKFKGNKFREGDRKTPEGIYTLNDFLSKEQLFRMHGKYAEIYGSGAFPMDYPNFMDKREGKTGSGIWLHSTDDDNRIYKGLDSRGCVVVQNADLRELAQYIELNRTQIIVVQDVFYLPQSHWDKSRQEISKVVQTWAKAWQEKDFDTYIGSYDSQNFWDRSKGGFSSYRAYKKAVFSRADKPEIIFSNTSILSTNDYAVVTLQQDYRSAVINDIGKKTLYLKKDANYDWKIVGELFSPIEEKEQLAFTPSKRFFKE